MEETRANTTAKITAAGHRELQGFVVEPQKTQGTEINFDPLCGARVSRAQEGHSVRQAQSTYGEGRTEGGSSRRTRSTITADTATIQAINKYLSLGKASELAAVSAISCQLHAALFPLNSSGFPPELPRSPRQSPRSTARC